MYLFNKKSKCKKRFIIILVFIIFCAIPGIYFLILNPLLLTGLRQSTTNLNSAVLVSASMILFYFVPFIIQTIINNYKHHKFNFLYLFNKKFLS